MGCVLTPLNSGLLASLDSAILSCPFFLLSFLAMPRIICLRAPATSFPPHHGPSSPLYHLSSPSAPCLLSPHPLRRPTVFWSSSSSCSLQPSWASANPTCLASLGPWLSLIPGRKGGCLLKWLSIKLSAPLSRVAQWSTDYLSQRNSISRGPMNSDTNVQSALLIPKYEKKNVWTKASKSLNYKIFINKPYVFINTIQA